MTEEKRITSATGGEKGQKLAQLGSVDPQSLLRVAEVSGFGAQKYSRMNFMKGYDWSLSFDAAQRHLLLFWNGQELDEESGLPHLAHAAWHMLALLSFTERGLGTDDRYKEPEPPGVDVANWLGETVRTVRGEEAHELEHLEGTPIDKLGLARPGHIM